MLFPFFPAVILFYRCLSHRSLPLLKGRNQEKQKQIPCLHLQSLFSENSRKKGKNREEPKQNQHLHLQSLLSRNSMKKDSPPPKFWGKRGISLAIPPNGTIEQETRTAWTGHLGGTGKTLKYSIKNPELGLCIRDIIIQVQPLLLMPTQCQIFGNFI